jgi:hypothetical protein
VNGPARRSALRRPARYPREAPHRPAVRAAPALPASPVPDVPLRRLAGGVALVLSLGAALLAAATVLGG